MGRFVRILNQFTLKPYCGRGQSGTCSDSFLFALFRKEVLIGSWKEFSVHREREIRHFGLKKARHYEHLSPLNLMFPNVCLINWFSRSQADKTLLGLIPVPRMPQEVQLCQGPSPTYEGSRLHREKAGQPSIQVLSHLAKF